MTNHNSYQQMLASLKSMPDPVAAELLKKALLDGSEKITFARPNVPQHREEFHQYFGCPNSQKPCDLAAIQPPLRWEEDLIAPIEEIVQSATDVANALLATWSRLNKVVSIHEHLIRRRWLKKGAGQRRAIILAAWPSLPSSHRPDMDDCVFNGCPHQRSQYDAIRYQFPHMNLEDLTKPKSFLILLNARARHMPWKFAYADLELAPLAKLRPFLLELQGNLHTMEVSGSNYGNVVEWFNQSEADDSLKKGLTMHPSHGYQVLKMQNKMISFLMECVNKILHDIESHPPEEIARKLPEPPDLSDNNNSYSSLAVIAREAPYRLPLHLDLKRLQTLVLANKDAAEDHIWALREDPGYFAEVVYERREHRLELLRGDCCGQIAKAGMDEPLYNLVLKNVITDAYLEFFMWNEIFCRLSNLSQVFDKCKDEIDPAKELPEEFFQSMVETRFHLEAASLDLISQIRQGWPASPPIRKYYVRSCDNQVEDIIHWKYSGMPIKGKELQRVFKFFQYLWDPPTRESLNIHTLMDGLGHLLENSSSARSLTSPLIASYLSQLSVITECIRQLRLFQPWATRVEHSMKQQQTQLLIAYAQTFSRWNGILNTHLNGTLMLDLGKPDAKFYYPVNKRHNCKNVRAMRAAEASLDAFWDAADKRFREEAGRSPHDVVRGSLTKRVLQRTPPWAEPEKQIIVCESHQETYEPIFESIHDPNKQITGNFDKFDLVINDKVKTRGIATAEALHCGPEDTQAQTEAQHQPDFELDKRAYKVFTTLFHSPHSRKVPGDMPWKDFLYAMVSVGFSAQKLQGSAWQFTPGNVKVGRPIQFHEPHPYSKLAFTQARRFGRRLARTYGWKGDMFRLRQIRE